MLFEIIIIMIIDKKTFKDDDGSVGYIDVVFDSSNILKTTYFPKKSKLYVHFKRGGTYSYSNVSEEFYNLFESNDSQGKFLSKEIKTKPKDYPYKYEFKLKDYEIQEINEIINQYKNKLNG